MKLYYSPGTCSMSSHIVLNEAGINADLERVDLKTKKTETGRDFNAICEKSYVPVLELDSGEQLTEDSVIVQYLADLKPETNLAPKNGTMERVRLQEWLNYIASEFHKSHFGLWRAELVGPQASEVFLGKVKKAYDYLSGKLKGKKYLMGDQFTVADAYAFTVLNWAFMLKIDLSPWPVLIEYHKRVAARPKVQQAMLAEGLLDKKAA